MLEKELFEEFKQDKDTANFARVLQNKTNGFEEVNSLPENSFDLLYNYLIANYIMKTKESIKLRDLCFMKQLSEVKVHKKENQILYSCLRKAGFFEFSNA